MRSSEKFVLQGGDHALTLSSNASSQIHRTPSGGGPASFYAIVRKSSPLHTKLKAKLDVLKPSAQLTLKVCEAFLLSLEEHSM